MKDQSYRQAGTEILILFNWDVFLSDKKQGREEDTNWKLGFLPSFYLNQILMVMSECINVNRTFKMMLMKKMSNHIKEKDFNFLLLLGHLSHSGDLAIAMGLRPSSWVVHHLLISSAQPPLSRSAACNAEHQSLLIISLWMLLFNAHFPHLQVYVSVSHDCQKIC